MLTMEVGNDSSVRRLPTAELTAEETAAIRVLLWAAFADDEDGAFTEDDWLHALGGVHFVYDVDGRIVSHASVVEREIHVAGVPLRTGYVEAVATAPDEQRHGYGSAVMRAVNEHVEAKYEIGALGTGSQPFYERLGWQVWRGPSSVRLAEGDQPTPDEDGYIMVLTTPSTAAVDLTGPISCEWRPGDVW
jgi:aminoglycoside 2'-N-acetyltransferase I